MDSQTDTITGGVAEITLGIDATPGLNIHAQAEPSWYPVWTVDGDEARWIAKGEGTDGEWEIDAEPEYGECLGHHLDLYLTQLGVMRGVTVSPDQMRALIAIGRDWLAAVESQSETKPQPVPPERIAFGSTLERRLALHSMTTASYMGWKYHHGSLVGAWIRGGAL